MSNHHDRKRRRTEIAIPSSSSPETTVSLPQRSSRAVKEDHLNDSYVGGKDSWHSASIDNEEDDWTSSSGSSHSSSTDGDADLDSDIEGKMDSNQSSGSAGRLESLDSKSGASLRGIDASAPNAIHNRLTSFFSQLAEQRAHSAVLDESIEKTDSDSDSGFEDGDENGTGRQYVELDLALGVLSEQDPEDCDQEGNNEIRIPLPSAGVLNGESGTESEVDEEGGLAKLTSIAFEQAAAGTKYSELGRQWRRQKQKRTIEEVGVD